MHKVFLTGCDSNTEWMLPWFIKNFKKHNDTPIVFADFGVGPATRAWIYQVSGFDDILTLDKQTQEGWFYKPSAMYTASTKYDAICWLDTDIQVLGNLASVFDLLEDNKLGMVEDRSWSARRGEKWHNTGVVAMKGTPNIMHEWINFVRKHKARGDQEALHEILRVNPLKRLANVTDLPNQYNWLRIQLLDGEDSPNKLAMHWTGQKGKEQIRKLMYNE